MDRLVAFVGTPDAAVAGLPPPAIPVAFAAGMAPPAIPVAFAQGSFTQE